MNVALMRSDLRQRARGVALRLLGKGERTLDSRVPVGAIKAMMRANGLALIDGQPSWFYHAYGRCDVLTNFTLDRIVERVPKNTSVLTTGCGTGIMLFWLVDKGFIDVDGFDYLPECVEIANEVKKVGGYESRIWQDDGFAPTIERSYGLITALHWVFSAWGGNYGNTPAEDPKSPAVRERLLNEFLAKYVPHLNPGGLLVVELCDAVADYRAPNDHPVYTEGLDAIYPVRHSPEQVQKCATANGLAVEDKFVSMRSGHQPRVIYWLRKQGSD